MKYIVPVFCFMISFSSMVSAQEKSAVNNSGLSTGSVLEFACNQLIRTSEYLISKYGEDASNHFPRFTNVKGEWETVDSHQWSSGFFAGCLWYAYEFSKDEKLKKYAVKWTESMEHEKLNRENHNNGFMILSSFGNGYRITGNEKYKDVIIEAARSLASRYDPKIGMIKSMDGGEKWEFPVIVDNMVNLELLFWASKNSGDPGWAKMAESHALKTARDHVRKNGSTAQLVNYDAETGEIISYDTLCGLNGESSWARGQGQAIYGFAVAYRETGNPVFLKTAFSAADYFIDNLPSDKVPYWDFEAPGIPDEIRDSSAASIGAVGLLTLSEITDNKSLKIKYYSAGVEILKSLCSKNYLSDSGEGYGLLKHATWKKPTDPQADTSLIWGDYYFVSGLMMLGKKR